jgi:hypothetical protein
MVDRPLRIARWLILALAFWVTISLLLTEFAGLPRRYGWPLWVGRFEGFAVSAQPPFWVWLVNLAAGSLILAGTYGAVVHCTRVLASGFQFRLATLFGLIATAAVIAAIGRLKSEVPGSQVYPPLPSAGFAGTFIIYVLVDLTASRVELPPPFQPMRLAVRAGVLFGLACTIYGMGWLAVRALRAIQSGSQSDEQRSTC